MRVAHPRDGVLRFGLVSGVWLVFGGCTSVEDAEPFGPRVLERTTAEIAFARQSLDGLQAISFEKNREYCGYIGLDMEGDYVMSPARRGRRGSCLPKDVAEDVRVLASYHTHGAYSDGYDSEVPSLDDLVADIDEGVDGYTATPGGRLWMTDAAKQTVTLVCTQGCLTSDPNYKAPTHYEILDTYSLAELEDAEFE